MKKLYLSIWGWVLLGCFCVGGLEGAFTIQNGRLVDADEAATFTAEEHFDMGMTAMECSDWRESAKQFRIVSINFPTMSVGQDANYYLGVACFQCEELDFANDALSKYLKCHNNPQYFEEAIAYKFAIANLFKNGAKRHFFGTKQLPKWASGRSLAMEIYDEVIAAVPCHELAAWSLFSKGEMLREDRAFRESVEIYQQLIKRFPKHELAPESYLAISKIYIEQSQCELQNPDLLAFSQINLRRFKQEFPREERLCQAEEDVLTLKEIYARSLYETGLLYERKNYPRASVIYYQNAIAQFPDTFIAQLCQRRLLALDACLPRPQHAEETTAMSSVEHSDDSSSS